MNYIHLVKTIQKKMKELRRKPVGKGLIVALFLCLILVSYMIKRTTDGSEAVTSAANVGADSSFGGRELPIYCVDTTENKAALSFDAAWGAAR